MNFAKSTQEKKPSLICKCETVTWNLVVCIERCQGASAYSVLKEIKRNWFVKYSSSMPNYNYWEYIQDNEFLFAITQHFARFHAPLMGRKISWKYLPHRLLALSYFVQKYRGWLCNHVPTPTQTEKRLKRIKDISMIRSKFIQLLQSQV